MPRFAATFVADALARMAAIAATLLTASSITREASAKTPGAVHCYRGVCHRVLTAAETSRLVGVRRLIETSFYDAPELDRFNTGRFTSDGERFDAGSPSRAASSDLPDGTEVLVRNPANGLTSHLRINDFGPFLATRQLDVTRRVADDLGFRKKGVTPLEVFVIAPPTPADATYRRKRRVVATRGMIGRTTPEAAAALVAELVLTRRLSPLQPSPIHAADLALVTEVRVAPVAQTPEVRAAPHVLETRSSPVAVAGEAKVRELLPPRQRLVEIPAAHPKVHFRLLATARPARLATLVAVSPALLADRGGEQLSAAAPSILPPSTSAPSLAIALEPPLLATSVETDLLERVLAGFDVIGAALALVVVASLGITGRAARRLLARRQVRSVPVDALEMAVAEAESLAAFEAELGRWAATVIGPDVAIEGQIVARSDLVVCGDVRGAIEGGVVELAAASRVEADIRATHVLVKGWFRGEIRAETVRISSGARVEGRVVASAIELDPAGVLDAAVTCGVQSRAKPRIRLVSSVDRREAWEPPSAADSLPLVPLRARG